MRIYVGSKNQTKVQAVKDTLLLYPKLFTNPEVTGVSVEVPEFGHPKNITETVSGAVERAKKAFTDCEYSFGLEGGLMEVPFTKSGVMEVGACAIYDGKNIFIGLSPAFEWPPKVNKLILSGEKDASQAFKDLGYTHHDKLGAEPGGILGFLTEGRMTREKQTEYSIIMALIQLEKSQFYSL